MKQRLSFYQCYFVLLSLYLCISLTGCSSPVTGIYVEEKAPNNKIELKKDGTYFCQQYGAKASGKYTIDGTTLTLVLPSGMADRGKIEKGKITDSNGGIWSKK